MSRTEFSAAVRVKRLNFAEFKCEADVTREDGTKTRCNATLVKGRVHFDHEIADGLGGKATFSNCRAICRLCHADKTPGDTSAIARAKRLEAAHVGATRPKAELKGADFAKTQKAIDRARRPSKLDSLPPRRPMFKDVKPAKKA
jgi:hypothetical protein